MQEALIYWAASPGRTGADIALPAADDGDMAVVIGSRRSCTAVRNRVEQNTARLRHIDGLHQHEGAGVLDEAFGIAGRDADAFVLIAGGIGIAPIAGILRDLELAGDRRSVGLLYGARNLERMAARTVIGVAARKLDLKTEYVLESPPPGWQGGRGAITPEAVLRTLRGHNPRRCLCLLCGPAGMMLAAEKTLLHAGVPAANIVYEQFDYA